MYSYYKRKRLESISLISTKNNVAVIIHTQTKKVELLQPFPTRNDKAFRLCKHNIWKTEFIGNVP